MWAPVFYNDYVLRYECCEVFFFVLISMKLHVSFNKIPWYEPNQLDHWFKYLFKYLLCLNFWNNPPLNGKIKTTLSNVARRPLPSKRSNLLDCAKFSRKGTKYGYIQRPGSAAKGQLITKCLFGVFHSPKKCTKTIRIEVCTIVVKLNLFCSFFGRIEDTKKTFRN